LNYDEVAQVPGLKAAIPGAHNDSFEKEKKLNCCSRLMVRTLQSLTKIFQEKFGIVNFHHYLFLALLGIITAIVATLVDFISYLIIDCKMLHILTLIVKYSICTDPSLNYYVKWGIYLAFALFFTLIAASIGYVRDRISNN
jgi:hypothetical protein